MSFTRRQFATLAAAGPLAGFASIATTASAAGHSAGAPALYDMSLGSYRITALLDGIAPLGRGFFFGDEVAIDEVAEAAGLTDVLPAPVNAYLLQSDDRTILIDAGMGALDLLGPGFGRMSSALAALGVNETDIDTIIVTHLHPDHVGGLLNGNGPAFSNAEIIVAEAEHAFWTDAGMRAQAPAEAQGLFDLAEGVLGAYSGRVTLASDGEALAPGVSLMVSPGHTMGHGLLRIDGGAHQLLMIADTLHSADVHMALPDTGFGFDTDPALAAASRRRVFDMASADKTLIAGSHVHFPGFGRIRADGDDYRFAPATLL
ncbi:MAG: MBL fold metallo-hydrolase [Pseudomonadota bacterium]